MVLDPGHVAERLVGQGKLDWYLNWFGYLLNVDISSLFSFWLDFVHLLINPT